MPISATDLLDASITTGTISLKIDHDGIVYIGDEEKVITFNMRDANITANNFTFTTNDLTSTISNWPNIQNIDDDVSCLDVDEDEFMKIIES